MFVDNSKHFQIMLIRNEKLGFNWLHLSDLHIGSSESQDKSLKILLDDILELHKEHPIDLIFITGDIVWKHETNYYNQASEFIEKLSESLNISMEHIFCVPGNHDALRTGYDNSMINIFKSKEDVSSFIESRYIDIFTPKFNEYKEFINCNFPWKNELEDTTLFYTHNLKINGFNLAVIGINSAWAENIYEGTVIIGENELLNEFSKVDKADITIALIHHPLSYLRKFESGPIFNLLNSRCDFVLHGHIDKPIEMYSPSNETYYISAGSMSKNFQRVLSYNLVSISEKSESFVILRKIDLLTSSLICNERVNINLPLRLTISHLNEQSIPQNYDFSKISSKIDAPTPPIYLIDAIKNNSCILFAGAGASADAKLPTWPDLVYGLVKRVRDIGSNIDEYQDEIEWLLKNKEYIILANYCKKQLGDFDFANYIKERLDIFNKKSVTHELLAKIPFKCAITTNFDLFLEKSRSNSEVIYPSDFENGNAITANYSQNVFPIYKIHGSYDKIDSIVLTKKDFRDILFKMPNYKKQLKQLLLENTILFYGYSFADPDIDFLLQEIMADYGGKSRTHYALLPDIKMIKKEYLQQEYNIRVISYNTINGGHLNANEFLKKVLDSLK